MSEDLFITNDNKRNYDKYIKNNAYLGENKSLQETAYVDFMKKERTATNHHRTNMIGNEITDSGLMDDFKQKLGALTEFYQKEIPTEEKEIQAGLDELNQKYKELIDSANTYINTRSNLWKKMWHGQGYERLEMIKTINARAQKDRARLKKRAKYIVEASDNENKEMARPLWANVLAELRTDKLEVEKGENVKSELILGTKFGVIKKNDDIVATFEECRFKTKPEDYNLSLYLRESGEKAREIYYIADQLDIVESPLCDSLYAEFKEFLDKTIYPGLSERIKDNVFVEDVDSKVADTFKQWLAANPNNTGKCISTLWDKVNKFYNDKLNVNGVDFVGKSLQHYYTCYFNNLRRYYKAPMADGHNITSRKALNYRMAELLGLEDMVQESRMIKYCTDELIWKNAIATEVVKGGDVITNADEIFSSRNLMHQMNALELFDFITGQTYRVMDDFKLIENGNTKKIKLCNNEMSFGLQDYKSMLKKRGLKSGLGIVQIKKSLADRVLEISDEAIDLMFGELLEEEERKALKSRIHGVQKWLRANPQIAVEEKQKDTDIGIARQQKTYLNRLSQIRIKK